MVMKEVDIVKNKEKLEKLCLVVEQFCICLGCYCMFFVWMVVYLVNIVSSVGQLDWDFDLEGECWLVWIDCCCWGFQDWVSSGDDVCSFFGFCLVMLIVINFFKQEVE